MAELAVDTSQFKAGMSEAASTVEQSNARMKAATEAYNVAAKGTVEVQAALGVAFDKATASGADYVTAMEAAVAATSALSDVEEEETAVLGRSISARMAGSAELRVLEGNMMGSTRAASAFLSTLPGIGAAMQIAFPLFGIAAVVMILGQMVKGIGNVIEAYHNLGDAARDAASVQAEEAAKGIETVKTNMGIAEGAARAVKWLNPFSSQSLGGKDQKVETLEGVERQNAAQAAILASQNELNEAGLKGAALDRQKQKDIQVEIDLRQKQHNAITDVIFASEQMIKNKDSTQSQVEFAEKQKTAALEAAAALNTEMTVLSNRKAAEGKDALKPRGPKGRSAITEMMEEDASHQRAIREADAAISTELNEQARAQVEASDEAYRKTTEEEHAANERSIKELEEKRAALRAVTEETLRGAEATYQEATRKIQTSERLGSTSSGAGAGQRATASLAKETTDVNALKSQQDALGYVPGMTGEIEAQYAQIQAQITAAQRKGAAEREQIAEQEAIKQKQVYTSLFNGLYAPLQGFTDHWLESGQNMGRALQKMGDDYAISVVNSLAKIAAQELVGLAVHEAVGDQTRLSDARTAASGAYAATVGIPFIGPVLAPIAAGTAFAAVAAFDQGTGFIPREGLGLLHPGEAVLPPPQTEMLGKVLDAVGNGNKGGSGAFNGSITNHFHGSSGAAPKQLMRSVQAGMLRAHALSS